MEFWYFLKKSLDILCESSAKQMIHMKCQDLFSLKNNIYIMCWGLTTRQPLWVILCRLPEKGRKETEEIAEEMKQRDREERGTGMKVKKQKK